SIAGRTPQGMDFAPARILISQTGGPDDSLDVEPLHRVIAVDLLQIADENRIIKTQPGTEIAQRLRHHPDQQAQLDAQWRRTAFPQLLPIALLPVVAEVVAIRHLTGPGDALQHAPGRHFLTAADGAQPSRPQSLHTQAFQMARQGNESTLAA